MSKSLPLFLSIFFSPAKTEGILNVNTGSERSLTQTEDLFCTGLTSLADGKVFMAGVTLRYNGNPDNCNGRWHGLKSAYELEPNSESMTKVASMRHGRIVSYSSNIA
jgi:hypothetical protein